MCLKLCFMYFSEIIDSTLSKVFLGVFAALRKLVVSQLIRVIKTQTSNERYCPCLVAVESIFEFTLEKIFENAIS